MRRRLLWAALCSATTFACGADSNGSVDDVADTEDADAREPDEPIDIVCDCRGAEDCNNGVDDNHDGRVDCDDWDCRNADICLNPPPPERCDDYIDNDLDGEIDCRDSDCADYAWCQEVCDDRIDNDLDGEIDCRDSDCAVDVACPELCGDDIDNDDDGVTDCDDPDCAHLEECVECPAGEIFRGGECISEVPERDPIIGEGPFSYVSGLQIPLRNTDADCCFDFSGDGLVDNGLATLVGALGVLGEDVDIDATLREALESDDIALLFEWGQGTNTAGFHAYFATNDVDNDGTPDDDFAARIAGDGTFQLDPAGVDAFGSIVQFNRATETDGFVTAGPSRFRLHIPIDFEDVSIDLDLTIEQAMVTGDLTDVTNGRASVDTEFDIDGEMVEFGGVQLGGVVPLDQVGELLNTLASDCDCAGFDDTMPVITHGDDGVQYKLGCAQLPAADACTAADGVICENLSLVCSFLPSLPSLGLSDIDTDFNGVGDAMSVGMRLSLSGATLTDPPFAEE